ncbi:alpha/beta hydrolase fold [Parvibaculum lavamentivorans DS-1]|uniref:Alpha/beta hydrolase fold n=1 Tax=Parvibaculum lavamentivorans (strain DS-1 / DSM 13023 / NCIMB 13966) TaxID=402881 RepID=A7HTF1_PARL1|nr:alpha/beta fold hydrolase [Parvibaculum lavamentivorans]ABS63184.1 alpha/beta hydrolase fold [Parvibaculum lavamentivorans DS-1]
MAILKGVGILTAALLLIMLVSFWAAGRARPILDEAARSSLAAKGLAYSFIETADGTVHYRLEGPEDAPLVVLVHGFSTPSFVWDNYFKPLTESGYRVLAYDNFGRGLSDRPRAVYDAELLDRQLVNLLDALKVDRRIDLVGYSMGGAIATIFTARHTERVRSLTLIAPAGLGVAMDDNVELLKRPLLGDWIVRLFGTRLFYSAAAQEAKSAPNPGAFLEGFNRQLEYRGYGDALLSTMRHYPLAASEASFAKVGRSAVPVLVIWGEADEIVPYEYSTRLMELMPEAQLRSYPAAGHNITFAQPELVSGLLLDFLRVQDMKVTSAGAGGKPRGPLARLEPRKCGSCSKDSADTAGDMTIEPPSN